MIREIPAQEITTVVRDLCIDANCNLGNDVLQAFDRAIERDTSETAREVLKELKENAQIARDEKAPLCQDTGLAVVFIELGQDVHVIGGDLNEAGSYGYLVNARIPGGTVENAEKEGVLRIRLEVDDALSGGLAIYGDRFGRYPIDPTLIFTCGTN